MRQLPEGNYQEPKRQEVEDSKQYNGIKPLPQHTDRTKDIEELRKLTHKNIAQSTNNPGNITYNPSTYSWLGADGYYTNKQNGRRYLVFNNPEKGAVAMRRLLQFGKPYKKVDNIKDRLSIWVKGKSGYITPHIKVLGHIAPELLAKPVSQYTDNDWRKVEQAIKRGEGFN